MRSVTRAAADGSAGAVPEDETPLIDVAGRLVFGRGGNSGPCQIDGWSMPEPGYAWSIGQASRTRIAYTPGQGTLMLEITAGPNLHKSIVTAQTVIVSVNDVVIGQDSIYTETTLGFEVPPEALDGSGECVVTLAHPDAFRPSLYGLSPDERELGLSVRDMLLLWVPPEPPFARRRRPPLPVPNGDFEAAVRFCTALSSADLMHNFESLGHNCEFGLVQRHAGGEPLGLLRFGGISMPNLLRGIDHAFEGIEDPARLRPFMQRGRQGEEYLIRDDRYGVEFHTFERQGEATPEAVVAKIAAHFAFLRRQFQDVLETGSRIFVLQNPGLRSQAQVLPVLNLLRSHGPNVLLYVTEDYSGADGAQESPPPPGTVEQERADLFHGYIDELAPLGDAGRSNMPAWISICANTYRIWREQGGGAG